MNKAKYYCLLLILFQIFSCSRGNEPILSDNQDFESNKISETSIIVNQELISFSDAVSISQHCLALSDSKGLSSIEEIKKAFREEELIPIEQLSEILENKKPNWLSIDIQNPDSTIRSVILFLGYEHQVDILGLDTTVRFGTLVPYDQKSGNLEPGLFQREEGFSGQAFLTLKPLEKRTIFLRIQRKINKPLPLEIQLMTTDYWEKRTQAGFRHFGQGLFQGIIWALILYHLLLFLTIRDRTYLYYSTYMICISMVTLGDFGYWQSFLFRNNPYLGWCLFQVLQYATGIMTFVFMQSFVRFDKLYPQYNKWVTRFIQINLAILILVIISWLPFEDYIIVEITRVLIIPFVAAGLAVCYLLIRSKDTVALYFAVAGGIFAIAIFINAYFEFFANKPDLETNYARYYIIQISAILHLLTFSLGMGYRQRQKDLETQRTVELDKLKTRLYTNITHEFRTPLTVIMGMADRVKNHPEERRLIRRNSKNLLNLINQMLDLAKLESGNLQVNYVQGDIVPYLQYLGESFQSMADDKGINLTFYPETDALEMDFDEVKVQHIVYNLLSNAIKFTEKGGKVVFHITQTVLDGTPLLKFKVKDTGIGISTEELPFIFDRFHQVDASSTRKGEGTGIGLALTKELVELLNGKIEVQSTPGKGTEFTILLPVTQKAPKLEQQAIIEEPVPEESIELGRQQILENPDELPVLLIIEDNKDVARYIESILSREYKIVMAFDGQQGIDKAIETVPDIIISDVMMPEKNGYEVCDTLKGDERTSHIPIILLTAKAAQEDKIEGLKYGADAFLVKPFDKEELIVRLEKLVETRKALQERFATFPSHAKEIVAETNQENIFLEKLRSVVQENMDDTEFGVPQMAAKLLMSQMQVYRKLKALTNNTPSQFIRSIRLQKAKELLKTTDLNISEIAYDVGFADPNYFSRT
ncbi:MAG: response regulator, partial [Bacteroidetes bacterium]